MGMQSDVRWQIILGINVMTILPSFHCVRFFRRVLRNALGALTSQSSYLEKQTIVEAFKQMVLICLVVYNEHRILCALSPANCII